MSLVGVFLANSIGITNSWQREPVMETALALGNIFFHFVGGFGLFLLGVAAISAMDIYKKKNE